MTQSQPYDPDTRASLGWAGWITFAAVILTLIGALNMFQGVIALFDDGYFIVPSEDDLLLVDFTAWGVIILVWGALLVAAGVAVAAGRGWARWFAVVLACVNVVVQIGFLAAYPIWSAILILLDVLVIFALTARWDEARAAM